MFSPRFGGLVTVAEDPAGLRLSPSLLELLAALPVRPFHLVTVCPEPLLSELLAFTQCVLGSQLGGASLKSSGVSLAISSGVTPT